MVVLLYFLLGAIVDSYTLFITGQEDSNNKGNKQGRLRFAGI